MGSTQRALNFIKIEPESGYLKQASKASVFKCKGGSTIVFKNVNMRYL